MTWKLLWESSDCFHVDMFERIYCHVGEFVIRIQRYQVEVCRCQTFGYSSEIYQISQRTDIQRVELIVYENAFLDYRKLPEIYFKTNYCLHALDPFHNLPMVGRGKMVKSSENFLATLAGT